MSALMSSSSGEGPFAGWTTIKQMGEGECTSVLFHAIGCNYHGKIAPAPESAQAFYVMYAKKWKERVTTDFAEGLPVHIAMDIYEEIAGTLPKQMMTGSRENPIPIEDVVKPLRAGTCKYVIGGASMNVNGSMVHHAIILALGADGRTLYGLTPLRTQNGAKDTYAGIVRVERGQIIVPYPTGRMTTDISFSMLAAQGVYLLS
mmetsp:Transcript_28149/g.44696  ORF Transcript_28149/g.44696 Transcript_28149/m.44696 type:complete len:203 (-) Transcript_28149:103-711(-)